MSRKRGPSPALREARKHCEREFEPMWRPAPWVAKARPDNVLHKADLQTAARATAFAWLGAQLGRPGLQSFDPLSLDELRRAFSIIRNATITDVRRWADAIEEAA